MLQSMLCDRGEPIREFLCLKTAKNRSLRRSLRKAIFVELIHHNRTKAHAEMRVELPCEVDGFVGWHILGHGDHDDGRLLGIRNQVLNFFGVAS